MNKKPFLKKDGQNSKILYDRKVKLAKYIMKK